MASEPLSTFKTYWQNVSDAINTIGASIGSKVILLGGSDGTNSRALKTNTGGELFINSNTGHTASDTITITTGAAHAVIVIVSEAVWPVLEFKK